MWIEIVEPQQKINLLKSMGLYGKFVYNCFHYYWWSNEIKSLSDIQRNVEFHNYNLLDATFEWRKTPEGECFWSEKDKLFREKYRKMTGKE